MINWDDLIIYEKGKIYSTQPMVTIYKRGQIVFNSWFTDQIIKDNKYITLSYSKKNKIIVFQFNNVLDLSSLLINKPKESNRWGISVTAFFKFYKIKPGKYLPKLENIPNIGEAWVIYLNDGGEI